VSSAGDFFRFVAGYQRPAPKWVSAPEAGDSRAGDSRGRRQ
jgi:hypothetical protein